VHSPIEDAIASARQAGVKQLALFHHDPERSDDQLDAMTQVYCAEDGGDPMRIFFAREGQEIIL
jgi:ribonuclease BN (tRNA processing enzyme)